MILRTKLLLVMYLLLINLALIDSVFYLNGEFVRSQRTRILGIPTPSFCPLSAREEDHLELAQVTGRPAAVDR